MKKTKIAAKWFAGTVAATALIFGSVSAPAQAVDSGWDKPITSKTDSGPTKRDSGWDRP